MDTIVIMPGEAGFDFLECTPQSLLWLDATAKCMINPCIFQEGGDSEDDDYEEHTSSARMHRASMTRVRVSGEEGSTCYNSGLLEPQRFR